MKSKKIVALALVAAMSISMASMTAFAAAKTWADYKVNDIDASEDVTKEAFAFAFQEKGATSNKYFVFQTGSNKATETVGDKTKTTYTMATNQTGTETAELKFSQIKDKLTAYANDADKDVKFVGWSVENDANATEATAETDVSKSADDLKVLKDADDIIAAAGEKGTDASPLVLNPVWQKKSQSDLDKDAVERSNRPKVAREKKDGSDWAYTQQQIHAVPSKAKGEDDGAKESAEKCNTNTANARVYDVKPYSTTDNKEVILKKGTKVKVELPVAPFYTTEDAAKTALKEGKLKVFHIGSDNKSHPVSGLSIAKDSEDNIVVTFDYGTFSDFVVTNDPDAKAQAGEEEGASSGNPATGEASALPVAMLALAALSATGVVAYKKRKAE